MPTVQEVIPVTFRTLLARAVGCVVLPALAVAAACPSVPTFEVTLGRGYVFSVAQAPEGGYVLGGQRQNPTSSFYDASLTKLDLEGKVVWERYFLEDPNLGGEVDSLQPTADGGYIAAGGIGGPAGVFAILLKTDAEGQLVWQRTYSTYAIAVAVTEVADGFVFAGRTNPQSGPYAPVIVKIDRAGNFVWESVIAALPSRLARDIEHVPAGGFVVVCPDSYAGTVVRTDEAGAVTWTRSFTSSLRAVRATADGGFIVAGRTASSVTDAFLTKLDSNGNKTWARSYGGAAPDEGWAVDVTHDGGYVLAGVTASSGMGNGDVYLLKVDANGNALWKQTFGSSAAEAARSVLTTTDGGYLLGGYLNRGGWEQYGYAVKTDADGNVASPQ